MFKKTRLSIDDRIKVSLFVAELIRRRGHVYDVRVMGPNLYPVCFGNVTAKVMYGQLDAFDAFWNTAFTDEPYFGERRVVDYSTWLTP